MSLFALLLSRYCCKAVILLLFPVLHSEHISSAIVGLIARGLHPRALPSSQQVSDMVRYRCILPAIH